MTKQTQRDWCAEFKGKQRLTERELNLIRKRLNEGKIKAHLLRDGGYALTQDQVAKGRKWLMNQWLTPKGIERKNNPFGYREQVALESFKTIRVSFFQNVAPKRDMRYYVPVYEVIGGRGRFEYYLSGGDVIIIG